MNWNQLNNTSNGYLKSSNGSLLETMNGNNFLSIYVNMESIVHHVKCVHHMNGKAEQRTKQDFFSLHQYLNLFFDEVFILIIKDWLKM